MSKTVTTVELKKLLSEQIYFLQRSAQIYDSGIEIEAKSMATNLRVLLHDTQISKSLLGQLHLKKNMKFISTSHGYSEKNLLTEQCLLKIEIRNNEAMFLPTLLECSRICHQKFPDWWNEIILSDIHHKIYRRKHLIILLANKDGGAHIDPEIPDDLSELKNPNFTGWMVSDSTGHQHPMKNDAVYATMRQMTFEILQSLHKVVPNLFHQLYF